MFFFFFSRRFFSRPFPGGGGPTARSRGWLVKRKFVRPARIVVPFLAAQRSPSGAPPVLFPQPG